MSQIKWNGVRKRRKGVPGGGKSFSLNVQLEVSKLLGHLRSLKCSRK